MVDIRAKLDKPKRQRKRKARTEVSSASDSSSDSSSNTSSDTDAASDTEPAKVTKKKRPTVDKPKSATVPDPSSESISRPDDSRLLTTAKAEDAFDAFYLRQMTTELAEDLDKLRAATDFNDKSISMLVHSLKQGRSCFEKDERLSVGRPIAARES